MRRVIVASVLLGLIAGLLFAHHDRLRLSAAWPIILGFALWETMGRRGARGAIAGVVGVAGAALGYATFAVAAEVLPLTNLSLGLAVGISVGVLAAAALMWGERFPVAAAAIGYAAFLGVFQPLWDASPANFRSHGVQTLTEAVLALLVGVLAAAVVRAVTDAREGRERASVDTMVIIKESAVVQVPGGEHVEGGPR